MSDTLTNVRILFMFFQGILSIRDFTARKRSLGQANMFTGVCLSTGGCLVPGGGWSQGVPFLGGRGEEGLVLGVPGPGGGGCLVPDGVWSHRGCLVETPPRMATAAGGTHPTGIHSFSQTVHSTRMPILPTSF